MVSKEDMAVGTCEQEVMMLKPSKIYYLGDDVETK